MSYRICPMSTNLAINQNLEKVILTIEFRHFYIGIAYFAKGMCITAGALGNIVFHGKSQCLLQASLKQAASIENLDDIDILSDFLDDFFPKG